MAFQRTASFLPDLPSRAAIHEGSDSHDHSPAEGIEESFYSSLSGKTDIFGGAERREGANFFPREKGTLKRKILIIDDEPDLLMYLKTFLEDQGFAVSCVQDAQTALQMILEEKPDLICLDIMMPIQSGISFYKHLRQDGLSQEIPVIVISGLSEESLKPSVQKLEAEGTIGKSYRFLNKPVDLELLLTVIREVLPQ
jgi:CheY-like chemotaxis protein